MTRPRSEALTKAITIVCISDTHELHREVDMPNGDILIHAGDFTMFSKSAAAIRDFNEWLGELPHRHKILIPGNHEFFLEAEPSKRRLVSNATMLINESVEVMDLGFAYHCAGRRSIWNEFICGSEAFIFTDSR